jgi:hypothetical protein
MDDDDDWFGLVDSVAVWELIVCSMHHVLDDEL